MRPLLALLLAAATPAFAAPLDGRDLEAALTVRFIRDLARESAVACVQHKEAGGQAAQGRLDRAWTGPLAPLGRRLDQIQAALPRPYLDGAMQVQRQRLGITRPTAEELAAQTPEKRKALCDALADGLVAVAIQPEPILKRRGSSSARLLAAEDADLAELAERTARNLEQLTAPAAPR